MFWIDRATFVQGFWTSYSLVHVVTVTLVILNERTIPIESGPHAIYHAAAGGRHEPTRRIAKAELKSFASLQSSGARLPALEQICNEPASDARAS